jgi:hypothetical protein
LRRLLLLLLRAGAERCCHDVHWCNACCCVVGLISLQAQAHGGAGQRALSCRTGR